MKRKIIRQPRYQHYGGGTVLTGGTSPSPPPQITVQDIDGVPSFTDVNLLQFDQADGFTISNPLAGVARIDFAGGGGSPAGVTGDFQINNGGAFGVGVIVQGSNGRVIITPTSTSSGVNPFLRIVTPADTGITADTEGIGIAIGGSSANPPATVTRTVADGTTYAVQREVVVTHPTLAAAGATTITNAATFAISGVPVAGTNVTISNPFSLLAVGKAIFSADATPVPGIVGFGIPPTHWIDVTRSQGGGVSDTVRIGCDQNAPSISFVANQGSGNMQAYMFGTLAGLTIGTNSAHSLTIRTQNADRGLIDSNGQWTLGSSGAASAQAHIISQSTSRVALRVQSASGSTVSNFIATHVIDDTATADITAQWIVNSSGTAATGFGQTHQFLLETTTTDSTLAYENIITWADATHASRKARKVFNIYDTVAREALRLEASGTAAMIGFLGATASARQVSGANLTNNVSSGGTNDVIADFSDLVTYSADSSAIHNDIFQLARKLKQVNDALRLYGLLT